MSLPSVLRAALRIAAPAVFAALALAPALRAQQLFKPPVPPENPITREKAILGKILFWDEQLSTDDSTACGTCHVPSAGGGDPRFGPATRHPGFDGLAGTPDDTFGSPGVVRSDAGRNLEESPLFGFDVQVTPRSAPSMINAGYSDELFWDGRAGTTFFDPQTGTMSILGGGALENQAVAPPLSAVEMAHDARTWTQIAEKLASVEPLRLASSLTPDVATTLANFEDYPSLFTLAFDDPAITAERIAFAIATYQRTLFSNRTPFDLGTLTPQQAQGFQVFVGPGQCAICHIPPVFSDHSFRSLGLRPNAEDPGRETVTGDPNDRGTFKVPQLRNVGLRRSFMHTGELATIDDVVAFYNAGGGPESVNKDGLVFPLGLSQADRRALVDFVENGLLDPRVAAELPPFDRPGLRSELGPVPLIGPDVPGSGGVAPRMIATSPPGLGARGFRLGVAQGLGGATAFLVLSDAASGLALATTVVTPQGSVEKLAVLGRSPFLTLAGIGAGGGHATYRLELPDAASLAGTVVDAQWWVADPGAVGGFAKSRIARLVLF